MEISFLLWIFPWLVVGDFFGWRVVEGRAFLCKLVLGANQARPPLSSCSPIKTGTNAILNVLCLWIRAGIIPTMRDAQRRRETMAGWAGRTWGAVQAAPVAFLHSDPCWGLDPGGPWLLWVAQKSHSHLSPPTCTPPPQARAQSLLLLGPPAELWLHLQGSHGVLRCFWNHTCLETLKRTGQPRLDWAQVVFCVIGLAWVWHCYNMNVMTFFMTSQNCVQVLLFTDTTPIITNVGLTPKLAFCFTNSHQ